jgi:hypothetical protein
MFCVQFCFVLLHKCLRIILNLFKLFFSSEPNSASNSLLDVGSNVHRAFSCTLSLDLNINLEIKRDGKEHTLIILSLLKRNPRDLMKNFMCFRIHGQSQLLGMMVWLFRSITKFKAKLKEKPSYWFISLTCYKTCQLLKNENT